MVRLVKSRWQDLICLRYMFGTLFGNGKEEGLDGLWFVDLGVGWPKLA